MKWQVVKSVEVLALSLDTLLSPLERLGYLKEDDKISLLKIDVVGAEVEVLKGGIHTLKRSDQVIVVAYRPIEAIKIKNLLKNLGFKVHVYRLRRGRVIYVYGVR